MSDLCSVEWKLLFFQKLLQGSFITQGVKSVNYDEIAKSVIIDNDVRSYYSAQLR